MTKLKSKVLLLIFMMSLGFTVVAQNVPLVKNWQLLDYQQDHIYGISMEKAYSELLKGKKSKTVLVAVIDSGIDTLHEDLKSVLWHNPREKDNGKDNDKNGYKGDIYGWNFIGNSKDPEKNVTKDSEEGMRFYFKYKDRFAGIMSADQLKKKDRALYDEWQRSKLFVLKSTKAQQQIDQLLFFSTIIYPKSDSLLRKKLNKEIFTFNDLKEYKTDDQQLRGAQHQYMALFEKVKAGVTNKQLPDALKSVIDSLILLVKLPDTPPEDYRGEVVNDNYNNFKDRYYGNSNVMAGDIMHGTHVSGIIGAVRGNGLGINGVADNVKIMMVRTVPDGDEHDKDVALAIRYAVKNGAKIINMSFGKSFSPERKWVEKAIRYAKRKDVLLVKAAGNNSEDLDSINHCYFPTPYYLKGKKKAPNLIIVGASGPYTDGLAAYFSNYGKETVDVFAPGVQIYSTVGYKGGFVNRYKLLDGTSMASPVVTGLAAVLKSYYPHLSAKQIKHIIEASVVKIDSLVRKPGTQQQVSMSKLCRTCGVVNAYEAIKLAEKMQ